MNESTTGAGWACEFCRSDRLQSHVASAVRETLREFEKEGLREDQVAASLVDMTRGEAPLRAGHREEELIYPASVVKLFYLVAVHAWLEAGRLCDSPEIRRAMRDMIVDSCNEATGYLVDCLTGTTSGPELSPAGLEDWYDKRNEVNRYFKGLGYEGINVNRKPWCEGPYGREMQSVRKHEPNHRNWLSTRAVSRLLAEIVSGRAVTPQRSRAMMELLARDPFDSGPSANAQARNYIGAALPGGARVWSKAGWTSQTRHDAAYVELAGGAKVILVIFTEGHANEREILIGLARRILGKIER